MKAFDEGQCPLGTLTLDNLWHDTRSSAKVPNFTLTV